MRLICTGRSGVNIVAFGGGRGLGGRPSGTGGDVLLRKKRRKEKDGGTDAEY